MYPELSMCEKPGYIYLTERKTCATQTSKEDCEYGLSPTKSNLSQQRGVSFIRLEAIAGSAEGRQQPLPASAQEAWLGTVRIRPL